MAPGRLRRDKGDARSDSATSEIVALKETDRAVKAGTKSKARPRASASTRPSRAGKAPVRKAAGARGSTRR